MCICVRERENYHLEVVRILPKWSENIILKTAFIIHLQVIAAWWENDPIVSWCSQSFKGPENVYF